MSLKRDWTLLDTGRRRLGGTAEAAPDMGGGNDTDDADGAVETDAADTEAVTD